MMAAGLLTAYQIPQLTRIIRRRSAADFSIPAYCMVVGGLAAYCYSVWQSPGRFAACVSLTNSILMLGTVLYWRARAAGIITKRLEKKLKEEYRKKGLTGDRLDHAVYGTMNKIEKAKKAGSKKKA